MILIKRYHFLYKITCTLNNHYYIGRHSTDNIDDGYLGSGMHIKAAVAKYNAINFTREILSFHNNYTDLVLAEKEYITEQDIKSEQCYNVSGGGHGGYLSALIYATRIVQHTIESKLKISRANSGRARPDVTNRVNNFGILGRNQWLGRKRSELDCSRKSVVATKNLATLKNPFAQTTTCPYCNKIGQLPNMRRWYFENCKYRE